MSQKELFFLSIGVFLTIVALVVNDINRINTGPTINKKIEPPAIHRATIDTKIFPILREKNY